MYKCEYAECEQMFLELEDYMFHIGEHLTFFYEENLETDTPWLCRWKLCKWNCISKSMSDYARHCYTHGFHTKLKVIGSSLIKNHQLNSCLCCDDLRNNIPIIEVSLACGWDTCKNVFDNPELYYRHVHGHLDYHASKICLWHDCNQSFKNLKVHLRSHSYEKIVACPTCGGLFSTSNKFFDHLKRQNIPNTTIYKCSHCGKIFPSKGFLLAHMRRHINHIKCQFCPLSLATPVAMRQHVLYMHSSERDVLCPHCSYKAKSKNDARKHVNNVHGKKQHCNEHGCKFRTTNPSTFLKHQRKHNAVETVKASKIYKCHICEKDTRFSRGNNLTVHLRSKHDLQWPPGLTRFKFIQNEMGIYQLQTVRYESVLTENCCNDDKEKTDENENEESDNEYGFEDEDVSNFSENPEPENPVEL